MLTITQIANDMAKLVQAANAAEALRDYPTQQQIWDRYFALRMLATHIPPRNREEIIILQNIQNEILEFIEGVPARESDRDDHVDALRRTTEMIRDFAIGA